VPISLIRRAWLLCWQKSHHHLFPNRTSERYLPTFDKRSWICTLNILPFGYMRSRPSVSSSQAGNSQNDVCAGEQRERELPPPVRHARLLLDAASALQSSITWTGEQIRQDELRSCYAELCRFCQSEHPSLTFHSNMWYTLHKEEHKTVLWQERKHLSHSRFWKKP
jgi:hypothetical protein